MMYWTVYIYQLLVIIFITGLSVITGGRETGITNEKSTGIGGRIVNGTTVKFGRFKYIVSVRTIRRKTAYCAGSLITESWALTAAHCVAKLSQSDSIRVTGGVLKLKPSGSTRQDRSVKKWIVHPNFDMKKLHKDIALLMVEKPFKLNEYLETISWSSTSPAPGTMCTIAGWGIMGEKMESSNDLLSTDMPIIDYAKCRKFYGGNFEKGEICAGYVEGGTGSCSGDSGGPMECNGVLTGLVSGGLGCARPSRPGRYTDVSFFADWINKYIVSDIIATDIGPISTTSVLIPTESSLTPTDSTPISTDSTPIPTDSTPIPTDSTPIPTNSKSIMTLVPFIYLFSSTLFISLIEYIFL